MRFTLIPAVFCVALADMELSEEPSRGLASLVDCGVCKCVSEVACAYCSGTGGPATARAASCSAGGGGGGGGATGGIELVNCGVCMNVPRSSCAHCDGKGGPASITSTSDGFRSIPQLLIPLFSAWAFC